MSNEAIYLNSLNMGIQNYVQPMDDPEVSVEIRKDKCEIFGNIQEIYDLHTTFFPALQSCNQNVTKIAETFTEFVKYGDFYCYVLFMLSRERALLLCDKHKDYFEELRTRCNDKLGVSSFLLQPVQRLPRYQLLLTEVIKELSKQQTKLDVKPFVRTVCLAEKTVERFLAMSNESLSINEIVQDGLVRKFWSKVMSILFMLIYIFQPINMFHYGQFRKMDAFTIYDRSRQRQYLGKLFFFDQLLVYTEAVDSRQKYRGHYLGDEFGKKFCLFAKKLGEQEVEFWAGIQQLEGWYTLLVKVLMDYAKKGRSEVRK
jgi:RhoGEF domain